jgi:hypothetical protein
VQSMAASFHRALGGIGALQGAGAIGELCLA